MFTKCSQNVQTFAQKCSLEHREQNVLFCSFGSQNGNVSFENVSITRGRIDIMFQKVFDFEVNIEPW